MQSLKQNQPDVKESLARSRTLGLSCCWKRARGSWVGARRVALLYVSSRPPLRTGLATFMASGSAPVMLLHGVTMKRRFPCRQFHRCPPGYSLRVHWVPLFPSAHRLGAFAVSPPPGVPSFPGFRLLCPIRLSGQALACRWGLPCLLPTRLDIPPDVSRVQPGRLKQHEGGGVFLALPHPLSAAPQSLDSG
jgi:hypothetical protein